MASRGAAISDQAGLETIELFSTLEPDILRSIEQRCRWHSYGGNEMVLDQESQNRDVYFVVVGAVRVVNYSTSGREIAFANIRAGGYFGEIAALDGEPRSASVVTIEACRLASLSPDIFRNLLLDHPEAALRVTTRLAAIIRRCDDRIMDLSTVRAVHRVYAEIVRIAEPDVVAPGNWVVRPMRTHSDIASQISTTRETVARVLGQLATDGIVERKGKTLYIRDYPRLRKLVDRGTEGEEDVSR